jgi:hypothetical protein
LYVYASNEIKNTVMCVLFLRCRKLWLYPKGRGIGKGSHLSVFLRLDNTQFPTGAKILAEITLRIMDQIHGKHCSSHGKDYEY